jgi:large conductance mechanosensitive channel
MALVKEFKAFALKGNVIDLAVAVVIGAAFTKIVDAIVSEIFMPIIGRLMPKGLGTWASYSVAGIHVGVVISAALQFLIVALVLFLVVVKFMGAIRGKPEAPASPAHKKCEECLEEIPLAARRCRACGSPQPT